MIIIGCDYHPGFQQIAFVDTETGDYGEQRLTHSEGAEKFYRDLAAQGKKVRVGMEASGHARWFERLLAELNFELWIGDATEIARKRERKQKTDRQDAQHILQLLMENRFPKIWVPSGENRDLRQLLWASAPDGAGAHAHHEPAASGGSERRLTLQEEIVAGERTTTIRSLSVSPVGEPATGRSAAAAGSVEPDH